ncbi:uncharacterized protein LOC119583009 [Penaeus monodon]|uniref:uncharacterized protein LOC119583009 n=1 Tax=Penaeus monodon TaxID=6687 RepID=UPI0018A72D40|nr:uncharacterized protein LOC119583009 [Penaeus monodon]
MSLINPGLQLKCSRRQVWVTLAPARFCHDTMFTIRPSSQIFSKCVAMSSYQGQGPKYFTPGGGHSASRRGSRSGHMRSRISRGWEQEFGTSTLRFLPGPRPSKHSRRAKDQSARKIVEQAKLGERLAEFKSHPTIFPEPLCRPFHGRGCSCMPFSAVSVTVIVL